MAQFLAPPVLEPIGRSAKELGGFSGVGISTGGPGEAPGAGGGGFLIPFSVEGLSGAVDLGLLPTDSAAHELTPRVRLWYNFSGANEIVLQGRVDRATSVAGQQLAVLWNNNGVWRFLGTDATGKPGPVMPIDAAGDIIGPLVGLSPDLIAAGDVIISLFSGVGLDTAATVPVTQPVPSGGGGGTGGVGGGGSTGTGGGSGVGGGGTVGAIGSSVGIDIGFSVNKAYDDSQSDYYKVWAEIGKGGIAVLENGGDNAGHLIKSATDATHITIDYDLIDWTATKAKAQGSYFKFYLFEGTNPYSAPQPAVYRTIITDATTALAAMYNIIDQVVPHVVSLYGGARCWNVTNEAISNSGYMDNAFYHFLGETWIDLACARVQLHDPKARIQNNFDHTEDVRNTTLWSKIQALYVRLKALGIKNLCLGHEFHVVSTDFLGFFGTGAGFRAQVTPMWSQGGITQAFTEFDVTDHQLDSPFPGFPASQTIPTRDQRMRDITAVVTQFVVSLPVGSVSEFIPWQVTDPNSWLIIDNISPRMDRQPQRPCILAAGYVRKPVGTGATAYDTFKQAFAPLVAPVTVQAGQPPGSVGAFISHRPGGLTTVISTGQITSAPPTPTQVAGGTTTWVINGQTWQVYSPASPNALGEWCGNLTLVPTRSGLRVAYTPAVAGGYSPVRFGGPTFSVDGTGSYHQQMLFQSSASFLAPSPNGVKICEPRPIVQGGGSGAGTNPIFETKPGSSAAVNAPRFSLQGPNGSFANLDTNLVTTPPNITDGFEHWLEFLLTGTHAAGSCTFDCWVDNVHVASYTGLTMFDPSSTAGYVFILFDPTWGGAAATLHPPAMYWQFDELEVAV